MEFFPGHKMDAVSCQDLLKGVRSILLADSEWKKKQASQGL